MKIYYGAGGSITTDTESNITTKLPDDSLPFYKHRYMICESASLDFCRWVARNLGAELIEYDLRSRYPDG